MFTHFTTSWKQISSIPAFIMDPRVLFLSSSLILGATFSISVAERTARCKIKWMFGISCSNVSERLVSQIKAWQISPSCLHAGERCSDEAADCQTQFEMSRQLVSSAPDPIKATHTSPRTKTVNNLQVLVEQSTICKVTGEAVSEFSTEQADNSTNHCSLQNLMDGSALSDAEGYRKFSNKWMLPTAPLLWEDSRSCSLSL